MIEVVNEYITIITLSNGDKRVKNLKCPFACEVPTSCPPYVCDTCMNNGASKWEAILGLGD